MPEKLRIYLHCEAQVEPFQYVTEVRNRVYDWLKIADAKLATAIHDENQPKPYSISPINSDKGDAGRAWFEIFALSDDIVEMILEGLKTANRSIHLAERNFHFAGVQRNDHISYEDMLTSGNDCTECTEFNFLVRTPTAHHAPGPLRRSIVAPSPDLYFGSWLRRWKRFSGVDLPSSLPDILDERMAVSFCSGTTQRVTLDRKRMFIGFVGKVSFVVLKPRQLRKEELVSIAALARFSEYSGVGVETMRGMGRIQSLFR